MIWPQIGCTQLEPGDHVLLWWKGLQAKHKIADQWENTTYEIVNELKDVPVYKIDELPKPGEEYDESHQLCTRVVHWNMLFLLAWTETDIQEDRDDDGGLPERQSCTPQGKALEKLNPIKNVGVQPPGNGLRTLHSILGWWR